MIKKKKPLRPIKKQKIRALPSKRKAITAVVLLAAGLLMMPTGFVLSNVIQGEIDKGVEDQVTAPAEDEEGYGLWLSDDYDDAVPVYAKFYMWNLKNPDDFLDGDKPEFEEVGPYTFRKYSSKYEVHYDDDDEKVNYKSYSTYDFLESKSTTDASLDDEITNINPAYLGVMEEVGGEKELVKVMVPEILKQVKDGFEEEFTTKMAEMTPNANLSALLLDTLQTDFGSVAGLFAYNWLVSSNGGVPNLCELIRNCLPTAEETFFAEWANDYSPDLTITLILVLVILPVPFDASPMLETMIYETVGDVDIESMQFGVEGTAPADVNIITHPATSGIDYDHCKALWDLENPNSLIGMDPMENQIWFEAMEGDPSSQAALMSEFDLTAQQLQYITDWIGSSTNLSDNGWISRVADIQINEWNSGLITTRSVEEWLFTAEDELVRQQDPEKAKVNIFNNCEDEAEAEEAGINIWTVRTGKEDVEEVGQIVEYNDEDEVTIWEEDEDIEGTDGTQFAPGIEKEGELDVFSSDFMRVVEFEYDEDTKLKGIDMLRFELTDDTWEPNDNYDMDTEGLINLLKVRETPIMVSKPHFLDADEDLIDDIEGMDEPDRGDHDFYIDVEPTTGLTMNARKRIQINIDTETLDEWNTEHRDTVMPIFWLEEKGTVTDDLAEVFVEQVYGAQELKEDVPVWFLGIGAGLCVPGAALATSEIMKRRRVKKGQVLKKDKLLKQKSEFKKTVLLKSTEKPEVKSASLKKPKED